MGRSLLRKQSWGKTKRTGRSVSGSSSVPAPLHASRRTEGLETYLLSKVHDDRIGHRLVTVGVGMEQVVSVEEFVGSVFVDLSERGEIGDGEEIQKRKEAMRGRLKSQRSSRLEDRRESERARLPKRETKGLT